MTVEASAVMLSIGLAVSAGVRNGEQSARPAPKTDKVVAIEFCRAQALTYLKHAKTIEWTDNGKEEVAGQWLVSSVRDARSPSGDDVAQNFTCRVQKSKAGWRLRMMQVFKESSKTGRDVS